MIRLPRSPCTGPLLLGCTCPRAGHRIGLAAGTPLYAHVPDDAVTFASKPELALQVLDQARSWGVPFATVVTDAGYGIPSFLRALDERQIPSVCTVADDFGVRLPAEIAQATAEPAESSVRRRGQPKKPRPAPRHTAQALTADQPEEAWQTSPRRPGRPARGGLADHSLA